MKVNASRQLTLAILLILVLLFVCIVMVFDITSHIENNFINNASRYNEKTIVLVPYRNRTDHIKLFISPIHKHLMNQVFWLIYISILFNLIFLRKYQFKAIIISLILSVFLFLLFKGLRYEVYIIEQYGSPEEPFNRAKLFNVGVLEGIINHEARNDTNNGRNNESYCLILHDVDTLPVINI